MTTLNEGQPKQLISSWSDSSSTKSACVGLAILMKTIHCYYLISRAPFYFFCLRNQTSTDLWAHASHSSRGVHSHWTSHVWMSCSERGRVHLVRIAALFRSIIIQYNTINTLRSGGVQAVWQERLWPRNAPGRLIWHTEWGPWATWVPRRHEWLQEGHMKDISE